MAAAEKRQWYANATWRNQTQTFRTEASLIETACRQIREDAAANWRCSILEVVITECAIFDSSPNTLI